MSYILIAIIAYFLSAIATVIDKTMVSKSKLSPVSYTVSIAGLGAILILFILPFGFGVPAGVAWWVSLVAGMVFIWAMVLMFKALQMDDASRVSPMIGGLVPIFILVLANYALSEKLTVGQYVSFLFFIIGAFLIALDFKNKGALSWFKKKFGLYKNSLPQIRRTLWIALPAAILFAISHVLTKFVYMNADFPTSFVWTKFGNLLAVLFLLLIPGNLQIIKQDFTAQKKAPKSAKKTLGRFLFGQACGGAGTILVQYAIFLGSVSLVNALQGIQYAFVFALVFLMTKFLPKILKEKFYKELVWQKIIAIIIIAGGIILMVI